MIHLEKLYKKCSIYDIIKYNKYIRNYVMLRNETL